MEETENRGMPQITCGSGNWLVTTLVDGRIGSVYVPNAYFEGSLSA